MLELGEALASENSPLDVVYVGDGTKGSSFPSRWGAQAHGMASADTFARPRFLSRRVADPAKPSVLFVLTASVAEVRAVLVWRGARDALAVAQELIHLRERSRSWIDRSGVL